MVSTGRGHHWIIEGNTFEWANAVALDIGKEDWDAIEPEIPGCHIIRNNSIRYAGICGIAGPSVHNSLIEKNLIEWIGWQDAQRMAESAAVKFHFAKNVLFTGNVIRHIRSAAGIWLDVSNRNCRIKGNLFTDITTISAAIEIEATHDANQVDNNIIWNVRQAHPGEKEFNNSGSGIILLGTDKIGINNNLIANCSGSGVYTVAVEERLIEGRGGTARQNRVMGNIFFNCQRAAIEFSNAYNEADGNYYAAMPAGYLRVNNPLYELLDLNAWREFHGWDEHGAVVAIDGSLDPDALTWSFFVKPDSKPLRKTGSFKNTLKGYSTESIDPRIVNYGEQ
jgi:hypothetical protein